MSKAEAAWAAGFYQHETERRMRLGASPERTAELLRREFPDVAAGTIARAELAMKGMLTLPSTGGVPAFVGDPPRWNESRYGDGEYLWGLNRMPHWLPLLQAWALTGEDRFAEKVAAELDNWIATAPMPKPSETLRTLEDVRRYFNREDPWRALEVGIRMYSSWPAVLRFLAGTRWLEGSRAERFARSVADHAEVLADYSPLLWPDADHNHYMMEMLGLLYASLMLPEHPRSNAWRALAVRDLVRCCANQFTEGGGQIEGCPHYHIVCLDVIARAVGGLREHGHAVPSELLTYMRQGVDYMLQSTRPTGEIVPWGDSDPHTSTAGALLAMWATGDTEPLRLLRSLTSEDEVRRSIASKAWDIGDISQALSESRKVPTAMPPTHAWLRGTHQATARTAWTPDAASVFFACRSPVNNSHAHIDPGGFDYTAFGKPLLVDPARYTYREGNDRRRYKVADTHNVLTIDGRDPFEYQNGWSYGTQRRGVVVSVDRGADGRMVMVGEHENYAQAICRRTLVLLPGGVLVVVDRVTGIARGSSVQRWFHFNSVNVEWDGQRHCASTRDAGANVAVHTTSGSQASLYPGWISTVIDVEYPSQRLCLEAIANDSTYLAAAIVVPYRDVESVGVTDIDLTASGLRFAINGRLVEIPASDRPADA